WLPCVGLTPSFTLAEWPEGPSPAPRVDGFGAALMAAPEDVFSAFEPVIAGRPITNPWIISPDGSRTYFADEVLLSMLLSIPVGEGRGSESGRLAKAIDAWVAYELRRAGFPPDEVWPRLTQPRVVPRELAIFIDRLPRNLQGVMRQQLLRNKAVA